MEREWGVGSEKQREREREREGERGRGRERENGHLVRAAVDPVPVEDIADRLHVATAVAWEAVQAEEQQQVPKLANSLGCQGFTRNNALNRMCLPVRVCHRKSCKELEPAQGCSGLAVPSGIWLRAH